MQKNRHKQLENAQGMVEFALVLPILLTLIFGVFAFGHLFFVYSTTVSASREAARYGAAVGVSGNGVPRYRDCNAIIEAAVRVGRTAGVTADHVFISYDGGPEDTDVSDNLPCPKDGQGPDVSLGDRILIEIQLPYEPIVPFANIPSFTLSGTTARTIIKSIPVGEAPAAEDPCSTTTVIDPISIVPFPKAHIGEVVRVTAGVKTVAGQMASSSPVGKLEIDFGNGNKCTINGISGACDTSYPNEGFYPIRVEYVSTNSCFLPSYFEDTITVEDMLWEAETRILSHTPLSTLPGQEVTVEVQVSSPKGGTPTGEVLVSVDSFSCIATLNSSTGKGSCKLSPTMEGYRTITAIYTGDSRYAGGSSDSVTHLVTNANLLSTTTIKSHQPDPSLRFAKVLVEVEVKSQATGGAKPSGSVVIRDANSGDNCTAAINVTNGLASCEITFTQPGIRTLQANYLGDTQFVNSSDTKTHTVTDIATPTRTATPAVTATVTQTPTPTIYYTPTVTPLPEWCPRMVGNISFGTNSNDNSQFFLTLNNPDNRSGATAPTITQIYFEYPNPSPKPKFYEVRFGGTSLFYSNQDIQYTPVTIGAGGLNWTNASADPRKLAPGETKELRFYFRRVLISGPYKVHVTFDNGCPLELSGAKN
jgi:hypothetical protein